MVVFKFLVFQAAVIEDCIRLPYWRRLKNILTTYRHLF